MQQKAFSLHLPALAALLLLTILGQAFPDAAMAQPPRRLIVTYVKYPLNAPLIVAKALGLLEKEFEPKGVSVEWADIVTGPAQAAAVASGAVQIASVISSDAVIAARSRGEPVRAVAVAARAPRTFCIMARHPSIKSVRDLKGKTVAGPKGTLMHLLLLSALDKAGMSPGDVTFVNMQVASALTALLSGGVDAALAAGPGKIRAMAGGAREVACGEGLSKGLILTAVNESFLEKNPGMVRRYLSVMESALAFMSANPARARAILASETGLSPEDVDRLLPEYDFSQAVTASDKADLGAVYAFMAGLGIVDGPVDLDTLFWP